MSIFSGLFKSRDKPKNSTAGSSYRFFTGGSTAGKNVTERSAMQMTAVYSCVRVLSEAVAGLPLHVYKYRSDGGKEGPMEEQPANALMYSEAQVVNSLMDRLAEKCRIAPKTENKTKAEDLFSRLDLIKNWR